MNNKKDKFEFDMLYESYSKDKENIKLHDRFTAVVCALELLATGYQVAESVLNSKIEFNPVNKLADQIEEALKVKK